MNEEAGFIAALLAEPDDRTTLLVYADWLDERADPRAEYLRILAAKEPDKTEVNRLRSILDAQWVQVIASRGLEVNSLVKILAGPFQGCTGRVAKIARERSAAEVFPIFFARPILLDLPFTSLERVEEVAPR